MKSEDNRLEGEPESPREVKDFEGEKTNYELKEFYEALNQEIDACYKRVISKGEDKDTQKYNALRQSRNQLVELIQIAQRVYTHTGDIKRIAETYLAEGRYDVSAPKDREGIRKHDAMLNDLPLPEQKAIFEGGYAEWKSKIQTQINFGKHNPYLLQLLQVPEKKAVPETKEYAQALRMQLQTLTLGIGEKSMTDAKMNQIQGGTYLKEGLKLLRKVEEIAVMDIGSVEKNRELYLALRKAAEDIKSIKKADSGFVSAWLGLDKSKGPKDEHSSSELEKLIKDQIKILEHENPQFKSDLKLKAVADAIFDRYKDIFKGHKKAHLHGSHLRNAHSAIHKTEGSVAEKCQMLLAALEEIQKIDAFPRRLQKSMRQDISDVQQMARQAEKLAKPKDQVSLAQRLFGKKVESPAKEERVAPQLVGQLQDLVAGKSEKKLSVAKRMQMAVGMYLKLAWELLKSLLRVVAKMLSPREENKQVYFSLKDSVSDVRKSKYQPHQYKDEFTSPAFENLLDKQIKKMDKMDPVFAQEFKLKSVCERIAAKYKDKDSGLSEADHQTLMNAVELAKGKEGSCQERCEQLRVVMEATEFPKEHKEAIKVGIDELKELESDIKKAAKEQPEPQQDAVPHARPRV